MRNPAYRKEILVVGSAAAVRLRDLVLRLGDALSVRMVMWKEELLKDLARGKQPLCILEHTIPCIGAIIEYRQVLDKANGRGKLADTRPTRRRSVTAAEVLPELVRLSPGTKFIITSHTPEMGFSPKQRSDYQRRPEVLKVIGFVDEAENTRYLLDLLERVYHLPPGSSSM